MLCVGRGWKKRRMFWWGNKGSPGCIQKGKYWVAEDGSGGAKNFFGGPFLFSLSEKVPRKSSPKRKLYFPFWQIYKIFFRNVEKNPPKKFFRKKIKKENIFFLFDKFIKSFLETRRIIFLKSSPKENQKGKYYFLYDKFIKSFFRNVEKKFSEKVLRKKIKKENIISFMTNL